MKRYTTLQEVQQAVRGGTKVYWKNKGYEVSLTRLKDGTEQWLVCYTPNPNCIGLFHRDGVKSDHQPEDFFSE